MSAYGNNAIIKYRNDIGKTMLSRDRVKKGTITNIISRWCGGCQSVRLVYSVRWEDGRRTYPCPAGCDVEGGCIHIM